MFQLRALGAIDQEYGGGSGPDDPGSSAGGSVPGSIPVPPRTMQWVGYTPPKGYYQPPLPYQPPAYTPPAGQMPLPLPLPQTPGVPPPSSLPPTTPQPAGTQVTVTPSPQVMYPEAYEPALSNKKIWLVAILIGGGLLGALIFALARR